MVVMPLKNDNSICCFAMLFVKNRRRQLELFIGLIEHTLHTAFLKKEKNIGRSLELLNYREKKSLGTVRYYPCVPLQPLCAATTIVCCCNHCVLQQLLRAAAELT